jgi:UDP-3-O-[3-hydroxymyristoyl] glucosamine N-acyltransferase
MKIFHRTRRKQSLYQSQKCRFSYVSSFRDVCTSYACIVDIHPTAVVDPNVIGSGAKIGACCYIGPDVKIGANAIIYPNVTILMHLL